MNTVSEPVLEVTALFLMSLLGAVILFKFFKSAALVRTKEYRAGGAIAGFIILFGILYSSYYQLEKSEYHSIIADYKRLNETKQIFGTVEANQPNTRILLAIEDTAPDGAGEFSMRARCIDPKDGQIAVYAITPDRYFSRLILRAEDMKNVRIPMK